MTDKVDMSEVNELSSDLNKFQTDFSNNIEQFETKIDHLVNLRGFTGETARMSKNYFEGYINVISQSLKQIIEDLNSDYKDNINNFEQKVDSSSHAKIMTTYLENIKTQIKDEYQNLSDEHSKIRMVINSVKSHINPPLLHFNEDVTLRKDNLLKHLDELSSDFDDFASKNKNTAIKYHLQSIQKMLNEAESNAKRTDDINRFKDNQRTGNDQIIDLKKYNGEPKSGTAVAAGIFKFPGKLLDNYKKLTGGAAVLYMYRDMGAKARNHFAKHGQTNFKQHRYARYNNLYRYVNIDKIPNKELAKLIKDYSNNLTKNKFNFVKTYRQYQSKFNSNEKRSNLKNRFDSKYNNQQVRNMRSVYNQKGYWNSFKETYKYSFKEGLNNLKNKTNFNKVKNITKVWTDNSIYKTAASNIKDAQGKIDKLKVRSNALSKQIDANLSKTADKIQSGLKNSIDTKVKDFKSSNILGKTTRLAGPIGTGLTIVDNFSKHKDNPKKLVISTAVDLGTSAASAATGAAIGSAIVPPIGTVVGAGVGIAIDAGLNYKFGDPPKSVKDRAKDGINKAVDKITGWFKK